MIPQTWYRGETTTYVLTYVVNGVPTTLANASAVELQLKAAPGTADPPLATLSLGAGIALRNQTTSPGQADVVIPYDWLTGVGTPAGTYYFDVVVVFPGPTRRYVVRPTRVVVRDVVNPP